jgi:hypothetical protein
MANLTTFSMLKEKVNKYRTDYSLDTASMAFEWVVLETILGLNSDEIVDAITDGAMDGGIDAIHIVGQQVHIFSFKYTEIYANTTKAFSETAIDQLLVTTARIFNKSLKQDDVNGILWDKVNEIWNRFDVGRLQFTYYLCSNMQKPTTHARRKFENGLADYVYIDAQYIDQDDFVSQLLERKTKRIDRDIRFTGKEYFQRSDGGLKGVVATISAGELIDLVRDPENPNQINEDVFNENVRVYLKLKNPVNRGIHRSALSDENYKFWYLNNGITIVCENMDYNPNSSSPIVTLNNLQIVNGGQTTHALFEAYQEDRQKVDNIKVLVRICETGNRAISHEISETTNSQTPVSSRDLRANDVIQRKLEEEFLNLGYYYERKKNQYADKAATLRLDSELLGQLYMSFYLNLPSNAKNNKTSVFGDKYNDIFDESRITASSMLLAYKIYQPLETMKKEIQRKKRKKEPIREHDSFISWATFHLLNSARLISEYENLDLNNDDHLQQVINKAVDYVREVVMLQQVERGDAYSHDKFFKEIRTNSLIHDYIVAKYAQVISRSA